MEKTDQQWEQEVVEEEEEEELLRGRKSRNQNGGTDITSKDAIALINGHSDENGENVHFSAHVNGAEDSTVVQKEVSEELEISSHGGFDPSQQGVVEELEISSHGGVDLSQHGGIEQLEISSNGGFDLSQQGVVQQLEISSNGGFDLNQRGVVEELEISSHGGFELSQQGVPEELDIRNGGFEDVEKLLRAESEDVNGKLERCVYFDDDKGMWKCRECCWTYQSGSVCNDIIQKSNRHLHLLMNVITGNQEGLCFISETKGTGFTNGVSLTEQSSIEFSNPEKKPADDGLKVNPPVDQILEHNNLHVSSIQPSEVSLQTEIDSEEIDLDVEGVLAKQNTHDLYCPNCNSCITRRVILRKRKRTIRTSGEEPKRNKLETLIPSQPDAISEDPTGTVDIRLDENPALEVNDGDRDQGPDIFRCLSCFSIFIPSEGGFKLFRMFGDKSKKESIQDTQQLPTVKRRWFSIFSSDKREVVVQKGTTQSVSVREDNLEVQSSNLNQHKAEASSLPELPPAETFVAEPNKNGKNIINSSAAPTKFEEPIIDVGEEFNNAANKGIDEKDTIVSSRSPIAVLGETDMNGKRVNNTSSQIPRDNQHQNVGAALLTGTITEDNDQKVKGGYKDEKEKLLQPTPVLVLGEKDMNEKVNTTLHIPHHVNEQNGGAAVVTESVTEDGSKFIKLSDRDGTYHSEFSQQSTVTTKWDIYTEKPLNVDTDLLISTVQDASLHQEGHVDICQILKDMPSNDNNSGKDTIITVETEQVETTASQISQDIIGSPQTDNSPCADTLIGIVEQRDPTATNVRKLEIIKSIVYGGLLESITSLGVISSAAGADASTVNVLALGIANLIGGLFVIGHDLWEVKESQTGGASSQVSEQVDRYQELLGRRSNFTIHAVVAVISFIIFGLIPPVIYGFSFRQSNDRDFKLTAVAAASLLCIILLAVAKAYVRRSPKSYFKTMMYYVVIATMASGASYVAGGLIMKLVDKLDLFEPSQGLSVLESSSVNSAWASY